MAKLGMDYKVLKKYRDFRLLWLSGFVSQFGSMFTYVALPFQVKLLTNSYLAVSFIGLAQLLPLIFFGMYGGVLADRIDRKKVLYYTEISCLIITILLFLNTELMYPQLWLIYLVATLFATFDGLQRPSANAILPRLVDHEDLSTANALLSLRSQVGMIAGPAFAGIIIAFASVQWAYLIDAITFLISILLLWRVKSVPSTQKSTDSVLKSAVTGLRYAISRQDLLGTYVIDLIAMFFAMPNALFPFWADELHSRGALGLFYIVGTVGALAVTMFSAPILKYPYHGKAVIYAAFGWGVAIIFAGITHSLFISLIFLFLAGGSDMISALFRGNIWNQSVPDNFRGRLAGIEIISYSVGPLAGQVRAGAMASWGSLHFSIVGGGVICIIFIVITAFFLPKMRKYDVRTNKFVLEVKNQNRN